MARVSTFWLDHDRGSASDRRATSVRAREVFVNDQPLAAVPGEDVAAATVDGVARAAGAQLDRPIKSGDRDFTKDVNLRLGDMKLQLR